MVLGSRRSMPLVNVETCYYETFGIVLQIRLYIFICPELGSTCYVKVSMCDVHVSIAESNSKHWVADGTW